MLKLKKIKKNYRAGDTTVRALKGIDLEFREHEFVAILGHSGCGKTTLLNIIGGLDHYSSGDLLINGKSTKKFSNAEWDSYRNHSIGFVFQSYNLIPHQTVLANVELALTLSGVRPSERKRRAKAALEQVGLGDQLNKRPNQMSGGQMQRVAIARALVNDPDILLADEPTGALDSETSVQIMEILKEISKNRLIIMVTHNPELADSYASRIIKLKDGLIIGDSDPYHEEEAETEKPSKSKRVSMSLLTALSLSMNNLMTKKARTILTSFAGSIGIIGIALIMSLSTGIRNYIDKVQKDTLSSYPITIEAERVDMTSLMTSMMGVRGEQSERKHDRDAVYASTVLYDMMNSMLTAEMETNNLVAFKAYLEKEDSEIRPYISMLQYSYDLNMNIYAEDVDGNICKTDVTDLLQRAMSATYGGDFSTLFASYGKMYSSMNVWEEMLPGEHGEPVNPLLKEQYELLYGRWPENYDETVLVVSKNNEISDIMLYALGLKSNDSIAEDMQALSSAEKLETRMESWSYEELCAKTFRYVFPADQFQQEENGEYFDMAGDQIGLKTLYNNGLELKVVGILRPDDESEGGMMSGAIGYTHGLVEHIAEEAQKKELVLRQLEDPEQDVFSGLPFLDKEDEAMTKERKAEAASEYIGTADVSTKAELYVRIMSQPSADYVQELVDEQMGQADDTDIRQMIIDNYPEYASFIDQMDEEMLSEYMGQMMGQQVREQYAASMADMYVNLTDEELAADFDLLLLEEDDLVWIYDNAMPPVYSLGSYKDNLYKLGYVDLDNPSTINIYASSFENKDAISAAIKSYNESVPKEDRIGYTDLVALLMSSITTIINVISYVLIAFVAISLVVSSIMIGIITYISVLERTKEIGILRAIGASRRDVSRVFNAETIIIGFTAGAIGILVTLLLNIPINMIVHELTGIQSLNASLPPVGGAGLVLISVLLTFIAGLIPAGIAAKKDPVEALRTE